MSAEKSQQLRCEDSGSQKRQNKSQRIYPDQEKAKSFCLRASCHQQHTRKCRSDTRCPGKAECKSHNQGGHRRHGHLPDPKRNAMLFAEEKRASKYTKLIQSKQNNQHASDPCKKHPVFPKKGSGRRRTQSKNEKGAADSQCKKQNPYKEFDLKRSESTVWLFVRSAQPQIQSPGEISQV